MQLLVALAMRLVLVLFGHYWKIVALLFACSVVGWYQYLSAQPFAGQPPGNQTIWDAIMFTIMLAPLRAPTVYGEQVPALLNVGRILLPFVFVGGIYKLTALRSATEMTVRRWFARTFRGHDVVCGLSLAGFALVRELLLRKRQVVLLDPSPLPDVQAQLQQVLAALTRAQRAGFVHLELDPCLTDSLNAAGARRSRNVYATTEDDVANLTIAQTVRAIAGPATGNREGPEIHVQFRDFELRDPLPGGFKLFDSRMLAARELVNCFPADAPWLLQLPEARAGHPHAMVFGLGHLGEQVIVHLARMAHYACRAKLHVTVIDAKSESAMQELARRYPALEPAAEPGWFGIEASDEARLAVPTVSLALQQQSAEAFIVREFDEACERHGMPGAIYLCLPDDLETDVLAQRLLVAASRVAVHARLGGGTQTPNVPQVTIVKALRRTIVRQPTAATASASGDSIQVVAVDMLHIAAEAVVTESRRELSQRMHEEYVSFSKARDIKNFDNRSWERLDEEVKIMNENATDHHLVKLRELGLPVTGLSIQQSGFATCDPDALKRAHEQMGMRMEDFAAAEHRRWMFDKLSFGWRAATAGADSRAGKLTRYLIEYGELVDDVKQYDRDNVRRAFARVVQPKAGLGADGL